MARYPGAVWAPLAQRYGGTSKFAYGRNGRRVTAVVIHRMLGSLEGTDSYFRREYADYYPYPRLNASTHFGVGLWGTTPQIRQWVDTANSAWGWGASPNDVPTALAREVLAPDIYTPGTDLNWQVISIEVEGFYDQEWDSRVTAKVKELLKWIRSVYGSNVRVLTHQDCSPKLCPGMPTFNRALPGYYGNSLGKIFTVVPKFPPVEGLPVSFTTRSGWKATIIANKPRRNGPSTSAKNLGTSGIDRPLTIWGEVKGQDFGAGSRWFFGPQDINGDVVVYIPYVDLKNRNF